MLKKDITYTDYDGQTRVETCYFNLNKTELLEVALDLPDGVVENVEGKSNDAIARVLMESLGSKGMFKFIKDLIIKSYGVKSADGKRFVKSPELSTEFSQTPIFDDMFMEMLSNEKVAADFVNAIIPASLVAQLANEMNKTNGSAALTTAV